MQAGAAEPQNFLLGERQVREDRAGAEQAQEMLTQLLAIKIKALAEVESAKVEDLRAQKMAVMVVRALLLFVTQTLLQT
jgi:hypothetical protein